MWGSEEEYAGIGMKMFKCRMNVGLYKDSNS